MTLNCTAFRTTVFFFIFEWQFIYWRALRQNIY